MIGGGRGEIGFHGKKRCIGVSDETTCHTLAALVFGSKLCQAVRVGVILSTKLVRTTAAAYNDDYDWSFEQEVAKMYPLLIVG